MTKSSDWAIRYGGSEKGTQDKTRFVCTLQDIKCRGVAQHAGWDIAGQTLSDVGQQQCWYSFGPTCQEARSA